MEPYVLRLKKGQDLKEELTQFCADNGIEAGSVLTVVGSLSKVVFLLPNGKIVHLPGEFMITSFTGTISSGTPRPTLNLQMAIVTKAGKVYGGEVQVGCKVSTTAEIVVGKLTNYKFARESGEKDAPELVITKQN